MNNFKFILTVFVLLFLFISKNVDATAPMPGCTVKLNVYGQVGHYSNQIYIARVTEIVIDRGGQGECPFSVGDLLELDNSERYSYEKIDMTPILLGNTIELTQKLRCGSSVVEPDGSSQGNICSGYYLSGRVLNNSGKTVGDIGEGRNAYVSFRYQEHVPVHRGGGGLIIPTEDESKNVDTISSNELINIFGILFGKDSEIYKIVSLLVTLGIIN